MLRHLDPCLMYPLGHGLAAIEKDRAKQKIPSEQKVNGAPHFFKSTSFYAALRRVQLQPALAKTRNSNFQHSLRCDAAGEIGTRERMCSVVWIWRFVRHSTFVLRRVYNKG
jgi:hypothetical protein